MTFNWQIPGGLAPRIKRNRPSFEEYKRYYQGFAFKEKPMFEQEIKDLEVLYRKELKELGAASESLSHTMVYYIEKFAEIYRRKEAVNEKLDELLEKTGKGPQEENRNG